MLAKFLRTFDCADKDDPEHTRLREALFLSFDSNQNGYISLAEVGGGVMLELSKTCGREAMQVYHRFYRSYIRAFGDAKDGAVARPGMPEDDDYVTKSEFRLLIRYLGIYATWYEVFDQFIDRGGGGVDRLDIIRIEADHRVQREEWERAVDKVRQAGCTWAPYVRLRDVTLEDFDAIDSNAGGYVDFREFCEWIEAGEKAAGTSAGVDLGVNEPVDKPRYKDEPPGGAPVPKQFSKGSKKSADLHLARMRAGRLKDHSLNSSRSASVSSL